MKFTVRTILFAGLLSASVQQPCAADVKLPALFSDHMVLQSERAAPIWGWAEPGEEISISIAQQKVSAKAGADGAWRAMLPQLAAGGPYVLEVQGKNRVVANDVLVGEVWLGSGQSNMAMTVNRAQNYDREQAAADWPQIRMFKEESPAADTAQTQCRGSWQVCSAETVGAFSATAYFFGRELHTKLGVPVGLINSSVGGTPIESWISPEAQSSSPELKAFFEEQRQEAARFNPEAAKAKYEKDLAAWQAKAKEAKQSGKAVPRKPTDPVALRARKGNVGGLFNGKIAPLVPYAMRGAIWYQGEANSTPPKSRFYQYQLPLLVNDWRGRWGYDFPFAWVQLPNFGGGDGREWPVVREAMLKTLALPHTGMAIAIDVGEVNDIHPQNKQEVGRRLALWALGDVYGQKVATSGPLLAGNERRGNAIVVSFAHADGGLVAKDGPLRGFIVAGADNAWKPATARIDGNTVVVTSPDVAEPVAVRYAWENNPDCNLYNGAGLPASPFRTDSEP